jgi:hypothetical protein
LVLAAKRKGHKLLPQEAVLIGEENSKRTDWPFTVVEELIPGRDGEVRLLKLKMASHVPLRPIQRIYPLEIYDKGIPNLVQTSAEEAQKGQMSATSKESEDNGQIRAEEQTRSGKKVKLL